MPLSAGHISYTLTYFLLDERGHAHVVDPGAAVPGNWDILLSALAVAGASTEKVASVNVTHLHPDHVGLAGRLARAADVPVSMHGNDIRPLDSGEPSPVDIGEQVARWGVPVARRGELIATVAPTMTIEPIDVFAEVHHGENLVIPGRDIVVVHTPGHTRGSITLASMTDRVLFTGDHLLPTMFPGLGLGAPGPTNPLQDYLSSLSLLAPYDDFEVLPGHGYRFDGLLTRRTASADHHLRRSAEVARALAANPDASVWSVATTLTWTAGWNGLSGFYLRSALAQTEMHIDFVQRRQRGLS